MTGFEAEGELAITDVDSRGLQRHLQEAISPVTIEGQVEQMGGGSPAQQAVRGGSGTGQRRRQRWERERTNHLEDILEVLQDAEFGGGGGGVLSSLTQGAATGAAARGGFNLASRLPGVGAGLGARAAGGLAGGGLLGLGLTPNEFGDGGLGDWNIGDPSFLDATQEGGIDTFADAEGGPAVDAVEMDDLARPAWLDDIGDGIDLNVDWTTTEVEELLDSEPSWLPDFSGSLDSFDDRPSWMADLAEWEPLADVLDETPAWVPTFDDAVDALTSRPSWLDGLLDWSPFDSMLEGDLTNDEAAGLVSENIGFDTPDAVGFEPVVPEPGAGGNGSAQGQPVDATIDVGETVVDIDADISELRDAAESQVSDVRDEVARVEDELQELRDEIERGR